MSQGQITKEELLPPKEFPFPFTPYGIQQEFMRELYVALEAGKIGIFESPTGTGKSMSLICGALKWLKDSDERDRKEADNILTGKQSCLTSCKQGKSCSQKGPSTEPDWMRDFEDRQEAKEKAAKLKEAAERKLRRQERAKKLKEQYGPLAKHWVKKKLPTDDTASVEKKLVGSHDLGSHDDDDDADIVLAEYDSDTTITRGSYDTDRRCVNTVPW